MTKILLTFAMCLIFIKAISQIDKEVFNIRNVSLEIVSARRIPYNKISVDIFLKKECRIKVKSIPLEDEKKWAYSKMDTVFLLNARNFERIKSSLKRLEPNDFFTDEQYSFKGGYTSVLKYGGLGGDISYTFRSPNTRTETRGLNYYMCTCALILETAGFSKADISRFLGLKTPPQGCN